MPQEILTLGGDNLTLIEEPLTLGVDPTFISTSDRQGRRELVWVYDALGEQAGVIARGFRELYTERQLDTTETLCFEIPATHNKAYLLAVDRIVKHRTRRYYVRDLIEERRGTETTISVNAEALWYRLGELDFVGSLVLSGVSPREGLVRILNETGWHADTARTPGSGEFSMEQQDRTVLSLLRSWAKVTGAYLEFDTNNKFVALTSERGADLPVTFRHGRNLRNLRRRRTPPRVTQLYPFGADGLSIAGINGDPYLEDLSFYTDQGIDEATARSLYTRRRNWVDTSFIKDTDLLAAAEAELAEAAQPGEEIELDVIDISEITGLPEQVDLADRVTAVDAGFENLSVQATVTRLRHYWLEPWRNEIELVTSPSLVDDPDESTSRGQQSDEWVQFVGPVSATFPIRNDGDYTVARIPLRFREGGRANFHLDLWATGVGAGTMHVEVLDGSTDLTVWKAVDVAYTDGATARAFLSWATEGLVGEHDYRVRVTTTASGGPSATSGVNIAQDSADPSEAAFWIMAQGAVQETPTAANSVTFDYTGAVQTWVVPDNVTSVQIFARGAAGGITSLFYAGSKVGSGGAVTAEGLAVAPGSTLYVYVGGQPATDSETGGWPNGGNGGHHPTADGGCGGGGSSHVLTVLGDVSSALIVAPGGGGINRTGASRSGSSGYVWAGDGRFFQGEDGNGPAGGKHSDSGPPAEYGGGGATQFAGGVVGITSNGSGNATAGSFGQGGDGADGTSSFEFYPGGGGGGWYGGGGGGKPRVLGGGSYGGDGGGGSGYVRADGYNLLIQDGSSSGHGQVIISWETPIL